MRIATTIALFAAALALRLVANDPGPILIAPVIAAGWWFGRRAGVVAACVAALAFAASRAINAPAHAWPLPFAIATATVAYVAAGFGIGLLRDRERGLAASLARREVELEEVRAIRQALTPERAPKRPALTIGSCHVPAEAGVAGDFFLITPGVEGESTVIVVGDVAGKGIEAARRAALVRATLATAAMVTDEPCELLGRANSELIARQGHSSAFVTAACLTFYPETGEIAWALAGHPLPLRLDSGVELDHEAEASPPLGMARELDCHEGSVVLSPGEGIVVFTDGLTEARRHEKGELVLLGGQRVAQVVAEMQRVAPDEVVRELRRTAEDFTSGPLADDLCIVAFRAEAA